MTSFQIADRIPHRPPMLLVDQIVRQEPGRIVCRKTFRPGEFFLQGHFPDFPVVPGVILCEAAMQAGALLLSRAGSTDGQIPVVTRMGDVQFRRMVRPGEEVELEVVLEEELSGVCFMAATVRRAGQTVARLRFACKLVRLEELRSEERTGPPGAEGT